MPELNISEDRSLRITYGALIAMLTFIFFVAGWVMSIEIRAQSTSENVDRMRDVYKESYEKVGDAVITIDKRLSRIEGLLERNNK